MQKNKHFRDTLGGFLAIVALIAAFAILIQNDQLNFSHIYEDDVGGKATYQDIVDTIPIHEKTSRFVSDKKMPLDKCWVNNGCYGMLKGTTYACNNLGYVSGERTCHCNIDCSVRMN